MAAVLTNTLFSWSGRLPTTPLHTHMVVYDCDRQEGTGQEGQDWKAGTLRQGPGMPGRTPSFLRHPPPREAACHLLCCAAFLHFGATYLGKETGMSVCSPSPCLGEARSSTHPHAFALPFISSMKTFSLELVWTIKQGRLPCPCLEEPPPASWAGTQTSAGQTRLEMPPAAWNNEHCTGDDLYLFRSLRQGQISGACLLYVRT